MKNLHAQNHSTTKSSQESWRSHAACTYNPSPILTEVVKCKFKEITKAFGLEPHFKKYFFTNGSQLLLRLFNTSLDYPYTLWSHGTFIAVFKIYISIHHVISQFIDYTPEIWPSVFNALFPLSFSNFVFAILTLLAENRCTIYCNQRVFKVKLSTLL